jgi:hypothetical protein
MMSISFEFTVTTDKCSQIKSGKDVVCSEMNDYLICKTNTLTILMHQMHISTTQVSSVMLGSKKLEIPVKNVKTERVVG